MDPALVVVSVAAVVVATVASFLGVRRARAGARSARAEADRARDELSSALRSSDADRRSASLALSRMLEGVILFDPDGKTTLANPAIEEHLGGLPTSADDLPEGLREAVHQTVLTHLISEAEIEMRAGTDRRWLRGAATPVGDDDTVLLVVRDVTEARQLDAVRRDFVANASHELKTPVASILAAAETIRTAALDDPSVVPRFAEQLEQDAVRLSRIISDLLDLSRLESGSALDDVVALDAIVREEAERFEGRATDAGVTLTIDVRERGSVRGSRRDLALLVRNLMDNAVRYTRSGGRVDVRVSSDDGEVLLAVEDTGLGISKRDLPRIFERFYRVDRARSRSTGGTGLGLAIVRHVAENHGGRVDVRSELGRGTRFEVRFPADV